MDNLKSLIPHREPFLFAGRIIEASVDEIVAEKTFDERDTWLKGSFKNSEFNFVPGMILVESMAQCGGAGIKYLGLSEGLFGLASIDKVQFLAGAKFGETIKYTIKNIRVSNKIIKQSGVGFVGNKPVVEADWLCVKIDG